MEIMHFDSLKLNSGYRLIVVISIMILINFLGNLEWEDSKTKNRCFVYWRTPDEWADVINAWVTYFFNYIIIKGGFLKFKSILSILWNPKLERVFRELLQIVAIS